MSTGACVVVDCNKGGLAGVAVTMVPSLIAYGSVKTLVTAWPPATQRLESASKLSAW